MTRPVIRPDSPGMMEVLSPPTNPWLKACGKKAAVPEGVLLVQHSSDEGDAFERQERLRCARAALREFVEPG